MTEIYYFDSYALIEINYGNPNYLKFKDEIIVITKLNVFELYSSLLKDHGEKIAREISAKYYPLVVDFDLDTIEEAAIFRNHNKKKNLSMTDCIGYMLAKKWAIKFLTGDKEFKDMDNVEFVK